MLDALRHDPPGERFQRQYDRLQHHGRGLRVMMAIGGGLLVAAGIAFMILPGPGLPLLVVGLGLLAGLSKTLARALDRAEPWIRARLHRLHQRWRGLTGFGKALLITAAAIVVGGFGLAVVQIVV